MSALVVENVVAGYGAAEMVLKGASISVAPGEIVSLIGPNGAGKSTLMKTIAGLLLPREGSVTYATADLTRAAPLQRVGTGLSLVPQERNVFATLGVYENLLMGAFTAPREAKARAEELMTRFPMLAEKRRQLARTLSGGQRQILAMAMGLMTRPSLLMLDEPTAGLSPKAADEIFDIIAGLPATGASVLMVEQNALEALNASTRGYVLVNGAVAREGAGRALAEDPDIRRLFLGG
ncbi:ABC transporter ATP-binding protein [Terrarubrum flagellatum]|uniref:ABC transporter ATP-binding protein n=1 Tax=Terrirubrum flagellatum TaxID=2895980 RepID=UPI00314517E3